MGGDLGQGQLRQPQPTSGKFDPPAKLQSFHSGNPDAEQFERRGEVVLFGLTRRAWRPEFSNSSQGLSFRAAIGIDFALSVGMSGANSSDDDAR